MKKKAHHRWFWLILACGPLAGAGCVERRFIITTDPPEAIVADWKNQPRSASPADMQFIYYGKYQFTIMKDGYETLVVQEKVKALWYEWLGLDFVSENLLPFTLHDVRHFHYKLKPLQVVPPDAILPKALEFQMRGRALGTAAVVDTVPAVTVPAVTGSSPQPQTGYPSVTPPPPPPAPSPFVPPTLEAPIGVK